MGLFGFLSWKFWSPSDQRSTGCSWSTDVFYLTFPMFKWASLVAQRVKRLPTMQETRVRSLSWEDPLAKEWQPTPVLLPGESQGQRSLVGYSPQDGKESYMTE